MSSDSKNPQDNKECTCVFSSQGVNVFGYMVPWWVVTVVVLLVLYVLYDQGMLEWAVPSKQLQTVGIRTAIAPLSELPVETPVEIRRLLQGF